MSDLTLTKIRMRNGVWEGMISGGSNGVRPDVAVHYLDRPIEEVRIDPSDTGDDWSITVTVPTEAIADGVHTFLLTDAADGTKLDSFTLIAGEPLEDDLRAEVELLRAELDMLKRAFRRHCLETM